MSKLSLLKSGLALAVSLWLSACAGPQAVPYAGIASAHYLKRNPRDDSGKVPYSYSTPVNWTNYSKIIIDPVQIYEGPDNQFGGMTEKNKSDLAQYMQTKFGDVMAMHFAHATTPSPNTLRLKLTLTGASSTGFIGRLAHIDMGGNAYNAVQAVRGGPGLASGWVMYAVEVKDASTGQLLEAYETKEFPNALNINAAFGALAAAKIGIDTGAETLATKIR